MRPPRVHIYRVQRLAARHKQPVPLRASEANVRANLRQPDLSDPLSRGSENQNPVQPRAAARRRPDIPVDIHAKPIASGLSPTHLQVAELLPVRELRAVDVIN